jgi:hypothetical protein
MTISSQTARTGPYSGNGSTTVFAYDFRILDQTHIVVTLKNAANVETVQTLTTNYTVSGVGTASGGNITMGVAPASGEQLTFSRAVPQTQEVDLANRGGVQPEILEGAYDKLTQLSQDKVELLNRMPRFPVSSALTDIELPLTLTANTALIVNAAGTGYTTGPTSSQISSAESDAAAAAASAVTAANEASAAMPKYTFSTTTTIADPGVGRLRLNHATPSSASVIILDDQTADTGNPNVEDWLKGFDDSTSTIKGYVRLVEPGTPANYAVYNITGLTDSSGFIQLAVTHVDSQGTFGDTDSIRLSFARTGDKGTTGDTGTTGATGATGAGVDSLTTRGDLLKYGASAAERLAIGSANTVLTTNGTDPAWSTITNAMLAGSIDLASKVTGALPIANGGTAATSAGAARTALGLAIGSDVQAFSSNIVQKNVQNTFTKAQVPSTYTAALSATSGVLDYDTYTNFIITLASGSNTLAAPTTEASQIGQCGVIIFVQPSSSSAATLSLHGDYETAAAAGLVISSANNDYDIVPYMIKADNSVLLGAAQLNFG